MEGLLSMLLFGSLYFLMMRFGCGAHVMHGGGSKSQLSLAPQIAKRQPCRLTAYER